MFAHRQFVSVCFRGCAPERQAELAPTWPTACAILLWTPDTPRGVLCCAVLCCAVSCRLCCVLCRRMAAYSRPGALLEKGPQPAHQWPMAAPIGMPLQKCDGWGDNGRPGPPALERWSRVALGLVRNLQGSAIPADLGGSHGLLAARAQSVALAKQESAAQASTAQLPARASRPGSAPSVRRLAALIGTDRARLLPAASRNSLHQSLFFLPHLPSPHHHRPRRGIARLLRLSRDSARAMHRA